VSGAVCVPETIPNKDQDVNIWWWLSAASQDRWKSSPINWENPRRDQVHVKGNHLLIQNTCVYWVKQWARLCGWGGTVDGWGIRNKLEAIHGLPPSKFMENKTYKQDSQITIKKLCQETHLQWDQLLPIALLRIRSSPTKRTSLFPFKILFGCPPPLVKSL
jgi:hypothetical protein